MKKRLEEAKRKLNDKTDPEFPWGILFLGVLTMLFYLGYISIEAGMGINGAVMGISIGTIGWSAGKYFAEANQRTARREHREEVADLRMRVKRLREQASHRAYDGVDVVAAAQDIVNSAKIRREDLDDDDEHFMYEVQPDLMLRLSEALEVSNAKPC